MISMVNDVDQYGQYAGPSNPVGGNYGFNDPDMVESGVSPNGSGGAAAGSGMSLAEDRTEFSLWSMLSAPLILGANMAPQSDVTAAENYTQTNTDLGIASELVAATTSQDSYDLALFGNSNVISLDQDSLGAQASVVSTCGGNLILAKPLANGDVAVSLTNESGTPITMSTNVGSVGLATNSASVYTLDNLWTNQVAETAGTIAAAVAPHATVLYRVSSPQTQSAQNSALGDPSSITLSTSSGTANINPGVPATATVSLSNYGVNSVSGATIGLNVPAGWSATPDSTAPSSLSTNETGNENFTVSPPNSTSSPISSISWTGTASYTDSAGAESATASLSIPFVSPVTAPYQTADTTSGPPAVLGELGNAFAIQASGTGIAAATSRSAASNQYATSYLPGVFTPGANTAFTARVTGESTGRGGEAGIVVRNSASGSGAEGAALYLNNAGKAVLAWDAGGGNNVTNSTTSSGTPAVGAWLQLTNPSPNTYVGAYSTTSANGPWTTVGTATTTGANSTQDVGLFAASGTAGSVTEADFNVATLAVTVQASGAYGSTPNLTSLSPGNSAITYNPQSESGNVKGSLTCSTNATASSPVSGHPYGISSCSGLSDPNFNILYDYPASNYTVTQYTPKLTWGKPASIPYGTKLSSIQLDAGADAAGTFAYSPASGSVLAAGNGITLSATFTPTDTADYVSGGVISTQINVNPAPLTITASSPTITYRSKIPTIEPQYTGLVNGDTAPATPPTCITKATGSSDAGTYPTSCTGASDPDYNIGYAGGTLTINPYTPVLSWSPPTAITYGTALSGTQLDAASDADGTFAYSPVAGTHLHAGIGQTLSATFTPTNTTDYVSGGTVTTHVTVNKAPLTVSAESKTTAYGTAMPAFTFTSSGYVNGETLASLSAKPTCSTTAMQSSGKDTSPAGMYPITCSGAASSDYSFSYNPASLSVSLASTKLTFDGPSTVKHKGTAHFEVTLTSPATGQSVANRHVTVALANQGATCTTNPFGLAKCVIGDIQAKKGMRTLTMTFAGDPHGAHYDYSGSTATAVITVKK